MMQTDQPPQQTCQSTAHDPDCICHGNWRAIMKEYRPLIGRKYREDRTGDLWTFFGVVDGEDDYYYGMWARGKESRLLSCVTNIETFGYTLVDDA